MLKCGGVCSLNDAREVWHGRFSQKGELRSRVGHCHTSKTMGHVFFPVSSFSDSVL